jgi:hypothetical protein
MDEQIDVQLAGGRNDRRTDGEWLLKSRLIEKPRAGRKLEPAKQWGGGAEIFVYGADYCFPFVKREIIDAHLNHRR